MGLHITLCCGVRWMWRQTPITELLAVVSEGLPCLRVDNFIQGCQLLGGGGRGGGGRVHTPHRNLALRNIQQFADADQGGDEPLPIQHASFDT